MRPRPALRDLQERLAQRLQADGGQAHAACWLAVQAGGRGYLLPLTQAGEIFPAMPAHPVPYTQSWCLGVVHLRGALWAAVDLAAWVAAAGAAGSCAQSSAAPARHGPGGPIPSPLPTSPSSDRLEARLVTLHPSVEVNAVLRIDRLAGLRAPDDFSDAQLPPVQAAPWCGPRRADARGDLWQVLDLQQLAHDPLFLTLADPCGPGTL